LSPRADRGDRQNAGEPTEEAIAHPHELLGGLGMSERAFPFIPVNARPAKPRARGITEIRGPYYAVMGRRYLEDILDTMPPYVDGLKFAGGSFAFMPRDKVKEMIDLAHQYGTYVSTGGWIEHVLRRARPQIWAGGSGKVCRGSEVHRLRRDRALRRVHQHSGR
jgi:hypothetical protein